MSATEHSLEMAQHPQICTLKRAIEQSHDFSVGIPNSAIEESEQVKPFERHTDEFE